MKISQIENSDILDEFGVSLNADGVITVLNKGKKLILTPATNCLDENANVKVSYELDFLNKKAVKDIQKRTEKIEKIKAEIADIKSKNLLEESDNDNDNDDAESETDEEETVENNPEIE